MVRETIRTFLRKHFTWDSERRVEELEKERDNLSLRIDDLKARLHESAEAERSLAEAGTEFQNRITESSSRLTLLSEIKEAQRGNITDEKIDLYHAGLLNGLILAHATMTGMEPEYIKLKGVAA